MFDQGYMSQPTDRSVGIFLQFPPDILQPIFHQVLLDELYSKEVFLTLSLPTVSFKSLVRYTKNIREVHGSWMRALHSLVFGSKATRDGIVLTLDRLMFDADMKTFPMLRDCMVILGHPYDIRELYYLQQRIGASTIPFNYICAVTWHTDDIMDVMRNRTSHLGYGNLARKMVNTFAEECLALGMKICTTDLKSPNGQMEASEITDEWVNAGIAAIANFFYKECLALWYYNAHMVRQILSNFPRLEYLELPGFLHVPLLAKLKYFFPSCDEDHSPFAPISHSPPQMLQTLGITYREQGQSYSNIMMSAKKVVIRTYHYNPILALCNEGGFGRMSYDLYTFIVLNRWKRDSAPVLEWGVVDRITEQATTAIRDIPEKTKTKVSHFDVEILMTVMDDNSGSSP